MKFDKPGWWGFEDVHERTENSEEVLQRKQKRRRSLTNQDGGGFEDEGTLDYEKQNFLTNQDGEGLKMKEQKRQTSMVWVSGMRSGGRPQDHHFLINFFKWFSFFFSMFPFFLSNSFFSTFFVFSDAEWRVALKSPFPDFIKLAS